MEIMFLHKKPHDLSLPSMLEAEEGEASWRDCLSESRLPDPDVGKLGRSHIPPNLIQTRHSPLSARICPTLMLCCRPKVCMGVMHCTLMSPTSGWAQSYALDVFGDLHSLQVRSCRHKPDQGFTYNQLAFNQRRRDRCVATVAPTRARGSQVLHHRKIGAHFSVTIRVPAYVPPHGLRPIEVAATSSAHAEVLALGVLQGPSCLMWTRVGDVV